MSRMLHFQQITDSRFIPADNCLPLLEENIIKIKELLNLKDIDLIVDEPYLIEFFDEELPMNMQYRANFLCS